MIVRAVIGRYAARLGSVALDPGAGTLTVTDDHTALAISRQTLDWVNATDEINAIELGDVLALQRADEPDDAITYEVTEAPVWDEPTWAHLGITLVRTTVEDPMPDEYSVFLIPVTADDETPQPVDVLPDYGTRSILSTVPAGKPPSAESLAKWLSITATDATTAALLETCCEIATQYELGRLSITRMREQGYDPPDILPGGVGQAMLMRAAAMFRRRNSVNGFEGFADLTAVAIRASDPDIERLVDPWRAWAWA